MPTTTACGTVRPHATAAAAMQMVVSTICAEPMPKMNLAIAVRRSRESSRPMLNSRNTTPNSASTFACSTWPIKPSMYGPTAAPPMRKPSTGDPPGILEMSVTAKMLVNSSTSASSRPASCASSYACSASLRSDSGILEMTDLYPPSTVAVTCAAVLETALRRGSAPGWNMPTKNPTPRAMPAARETPCALSPVEEKNLPANCLLELEVLGFSGFFSASFAASSSSAFCLASVSASTTISISSAGTEFLSVSKHSSSPGSHSISVSTHVSSSSRPSSLTSFARFSSSSATADSTSDHATRASRTRSIICSTAVMASAAR
mmetsp:Transcript_6556/g.26600  ORF Transcript_6556/g.26600 Transcript_6556/m.26600 type:complete len:319 (+) Transcript_6556:1540-2496(+)